MELQYRAARTEATYYKMLFLAALRGFSDTDETPYDPDSMIHDPGSVDARRDQQATRIGEPGGRT